MAYTPTEWVNDVTPINAENLNKIETQLKDTSVDYIVEEGIDRDIWTYRKWNSGEFDAYYASNLAFSNVTPSTGFGALYRTADYGISLPSFTVGRVAVSGEGSLWKAISGAFFSQYSSFNAAGEHVYGSKIVIYFWTPISGVTNSDARVSIQIRGRWKA